MKFNKSKNNGCRSLCQMIKGSRPKNTFLVDMSAKVFSPPPSPIIFFSLGKSQKKVLLLMAGL